MKIITGDKLFNNPLPQVQDEPTNNRFTPQSMSAAHEFGRWKVDAEGNMDFNNRYFIGRERLTEDDWIAHLFEKRWIDWNEFIPAFWTACKINKIEHVKLRVFYKSALNEKR